MPDIFISYRREDSAGYAGRLREALERRLGPNRVFRDVDTLEPGQRFGHTIEERIRDCHAFLALIGREWLDARDGSGRRRLEQDDDYVRLEIAAALARDDLLCIPVLIEGAEMPAAGDLPASIRPLAYRHAISLRDETWNADVDRLAGTIARQTRAAATPAAAAARPPLRGGPFAAAALVAAALVLALVAVWLRGGSPSAPPTSPYAIRIPPVAEIAHGRLLVTLISGSLGPRAQLYELRLRMRVSNEGPYDAGLGDHSLRLAVEDDVLAPASDVPYIIGAHTMRGMIVTFDMPAPATRATLRVIHGDAVGELPLDLSPTGRPPEDERADAGDALSRANLFPLLRDPRALVAAGDIDVTLRAVHGRRFANVVRLTAPVRVRNRGPYAWSLSDLAIHAVAAGGSRPPLEPQGEVVQPGADVDASYMFDIPPDSRDVVLRARIGTSAAEMPLRIP